MVSHAPMGATTAATLVLTVDDEPDINWILGRLIARQGLACHQAGTGEEAIALARRHCYHGIFVDAKLPDTGGLVLIEALRQLQHDPFVILISGYYFADDPVVEQATGSGLIQAFVAKPFMHDDILGLLSRITTARVHAGG